VRGRLGHQTRCLLTVVTRAGRVMHARYRTESWGYRSPEAQTTCPTRRAQNSLAYATRVRTIKNDVTKNEANKEILKLRKQINYWKEQARGRPGRGAHVMPGRSPAPRLRKTGNPARLEGGEPCSIT
jgi:hypothetical protein